MKDHIYVKALEFLLDGYEKIIDPVLDFLTSTPNTDLYRLGIENISGETIVTFSRPLENTDYYITIKRYTATNGVIAEYGWSIKEGSKLKDSFTFIPPARYPEGELIYEVRYYR